MTTTRRAFLKAATVAASTTSLLPFGKAAEQRKEKRDIQWAWRVGPWMDGRRRWTTLGFHDDIASLIRAHICTNSHTFVGARKDCLLWSGLSWVRYDPDAISVFVSLVEYRTACGYATTFDMVTGRRLERFQVYDRVNFYEIMPGRHTIHYQIPRGVVVAPPESWRSLSNGHEGESP